MAFDLTPTSTPSYTSSGAFGSAMSAGKGQCANPIPTTGTFTVDLRVTCNSGLGINVACGAVDTFWIGVNGGVVTAKYGSGANEVTLAGSDISSGAAHHLRLVLNGSSGGKFFVDGVLAASSATTMSASGATYSAEFGVHTFGTLGYDWDGTVDELAIFSTALSTSGFTAPTAPYANNASGIVALWHLDGDLLDSATPASDTTAPVLTSPTGTATGTTTATANVTTDEGNGTLYCLVSTNATETAATVKASGATLAITSSGSKSFSITGLTTSTTYYAHFVHRDAAGNDSAVANSAGFTPSSVNNALAAGTSNVLFSPYNWDIQASTAKTINAGAYFKTIFSGTACTLTFDMTGIVAPLPQMSYRVDRFGPWISAPIAASVAITIPSDTSDYANKPGHLLEVLVKSMTETQARWSTQATAVKLTGIILDAGKTISAPPSLPMNAIFYGDSITEGVRTVNSTATDDTDRNDAGQCWSLEVGRILGAEVGNVGFGATGFNQGGSGSVPSLPNSYSYLYSGVARSFTTTPDFIVLMEGTNDGGDVTSAATTVLNGLIAATTTTKIIVLRPFNGTSHASQLQAAIAACTAPSRVTYVDTAGWFNTSNSSDGLHPYGVENITHIAPLVADAVATALATASEWSSTPSGLFITRSRTPRKVLRLP